MADSIRNGPKPKPGKGSGKPSDVAGRALTDAKEMGSELIGALRDSATSIFDEQRNRAASEIAALGDVLRNTAKSLDESGSGPVAHYTGEAARQVGDFADRLRDRSWGEISADIEDFARRWPIAFMASAIAAGFVAGRFLVSSAPAPTSATTATGFQPQPIGERHGGARHDYGRVSGDVSGTGQAGYGAASPPETK